jgi:hypothetical protein
MRNDLPVLVAGIQILQHRIQIRCVPILDILIAICEVLRFVGYKQGYIYIYLGPLVVQLIYLS